MQTERFNINQNDYFEVSVFRYNNEPFVNLRSIHAHIDGHDYDRSDNDLRNHVHNWLLDTDNIDHINYISERLNHRKWFNTAYSNQEIDAAIAASDNELVLPNDEGHYIPEQLIQSLLVITPEEYEMDDMDNLAYYPIYKFFGRKNAPSTIHCVHFDILVYILMNRFPRIRADLTRLLTIELEIANVTNQTVEEITRTRLTQLEIENERLRGENTNLLTEIREIRRQNNQLLERTTGLETQLTNANTQLNTVNQQLDVANTKITRIGEHMTRFTDFIGDSLSEFNLTTASAKYVYLVIDRPSLVNEARDNHTIGTNQYLFDSICCLKINRAKELRAHNYDEHNDHIIIEYECSCSLDISKWIKRHFTDANCSVINTGNYIRKIRFVTSIRQEVIDSINRFLYRSQATKQTILEHIENMEDILEVQNSQIQELREQINQIRTLLNEHRPNAVSVYSNGRYRELITQPDGTIVYVPRARSSEIELTEEDIRNLKFKDVNGRFVNYRE